MMPIKAQGFSLIEIMIVVTVVGILSAITIPAYGSYVKKSRRSEATTALLDTQRAYESYFLQNSTYLGANTSVTLPTTTNYTYSASNITATTYTLTATVKAGSSQVNDLQGAVTCTPLIVDHLGNKSPADCWNTL